MLSGENFVWYKNLHAAIITHNLKKKTQRKTILKFELIGLFAIFMMWTFDGVSLQSSAGYWWIFWCFTSHSIKKTSAD